MSGSTSFDFVAISVPSSDADSLATQLTERSAQGWHVVSIVHSEAGLTAFCRREAGSTDSGGTAELTSTGPEATAPAETSELAPGWAAGDERQDTSSPAPAPHASTYGTAEHATSPVGAPSPAVSPEPEAPATPPVTPAQQPTATPQVPAGWYSDPSGRFELRYWDGNAWTEHVARNGQQYTDAPVP